MQLCKQFFIMKIFKLCFKSIFTHTGYYFEPAPSLYKKYYFTCISYALLCLQLVHFTNSGVITDEKNNVYTLTVQFCLSYAQRLMQLYKQFFIMKIFRLGFKSIFTRTSMPNVQDTILNLHHLYTKSTTVHVQYVSKKTCHCIEILHR